MPCTNLREAWRSDTPNESGKRPLKFIRKGESREDTVLVPCGKCLGCRLDKAQDWAIRCSHEIQMYEDRGLPSSFLTLTYNEEHLPNPPSINRNDPKRFIHNLRQHVTRETGTTKSGIRFFGCGEYGEQLSRPHYHMLMFGYQFPDIEVHTRNQNDQPIYTSATMDRLWGKGYCTTANASYQTAHYVARYITKKINGEEATNHYTRTDMQTGQLYELEPEFNFSSRMPGLGYDWLQKYKKQLHNGYVIVDGKKKPIPDYYLRKLAESELEEYSDYELYELIYQKRIQNIDTFDPELSGDRLRVKEEVLQRRLNTFKVKT